MKRIDKRIARVMSAIAVFCLCGSAVATDATVKVKMDDILHVRPVSLIGGNTEDLNYQLYGGLYSQLLHGEAFEEEIGVDFLGLTDKEKLQVWVRRDGRNQPFFWLFNGRGYPVVDDVDVAVGDSRQQYKNKKGKEPKPVTVGPLTFKEPFLSVKQLSGDLGKQLLERFTGSEQISRQWNKVQSRTADGSFTLVRKGQLTGEQAQQISYVKGSGEWGIDNAGLHRWGIRFEKGKPYEGILRVKGDRKQSLYLSLRDGNGKILAEQETKLQDDPGNYQRIEFSLTPDAGTTSGRFALVLREPGTVTVDYAFLQPGSWGRFQGLPVRSDMADAMKSMTVRAIRYNGSMVNRSPDGHLYKWKNMIGPRDERQPYHGWFNPYASHGFSFFEFMDFCEVLNIDCMFGIRIDETAQDVRDLVDYCLGSEDTEWGRKRIELGHPKPYRLQMIQIGNEEAGSSQYAERVKLLAGAIWDKNPDIQIALSLNVRAWEGGDERAVHLLDIARFVHGRGQGHKLVLDAHYHSSIDHGDTGLANFVGIDMHDYLAEEIPGFKLRLWPMEENGSRCDWDRGLAHAHNLNTFNRLPLCVERTGTANIFQAWDKNLVWDQGRIHFTPEKIFYQPSYYVDRMFGVEWLPVVLNVASSEPLLDVTAKTNEKGDVLTLYLANIGDEAVDAAFEIEGFTPVKVDVMRIGSPDLEAANTPENPTAIMPVKVDWNPDSRKMQVPGYSFTTIRFAGSAFPGFDATKSKGIRQPMAKPAASGKPNIVMVIGDDHGVYHSSPYGAKEIQTPNMQSLADEGMIFHRAYVAAPECAPSRAALMTGRMPYNNGIVGNHESELKPGVESLIPHLIEQGYEVIWRGKVGHGKPGAKMPYFVSGIKVVEGKPKPLDISGVEKYIASRENKSRPVAIFIGCHYPHRPWPKPEDARIAPEDVVVPPRTFDTPETRSELTRYVEAVETVDRTLGQTREMIQKHLDPDNTLIIYTADHGQAWPFGKWSLYETGIRTSLLAVWPGRIKPGSSTEAMVSWIDILPTFIDVAGGKVPDGIDGRSFKRVLLGETDTHRDRIFSVNKGDKGMSVYPCRSVRVGEWKYILNLHPEFYYTTHMDQVGSDSPYYNRNWPSWIEAAKTNPEAAAFLRAYHSRPAEELYRVSDDPYEKTNLADNPEYRATLEKLRTMVRDRMKEVGDDESLSGEPRLLKDYKLP